MNLFEAEEFFRSLYKDKVVKLEFDENCLRQIEIVCTDGNPNLIHHLEYQKVRVTIDKEDPIYVPIAPHRLNMAWVDIKKYITGKKGVHLNPNEIESAKDSVEAKSKIKELSGLTDKELDDKIKSLD